MKTERQIVGQYGEQIAVDYLMREGFIILERNWRYRRSEIDIIAKEKNVLVFFEVKTVQEESHGNPERNISMRQLQLLYDGACAYMERAGHDWEIRIDFISIIMESKGSYEIVHRRDAYWPE